MADRQVLFDLLLMERRTVAAYDAALAGGVLGREATATLRLLRDHEQEHARVLEEALRTAGGTPPPPVGDHVPGLAGAADERAVLDFVRELEEVSVAAYYDAQQKLRGAALLTPLARIMAVEGQHLVLVRGRLGQEAVPVAFETGEP